MSRQRESETHRVDVEKLSGSKREDRVQGDEPEAAVLLVACGIGIFTGAGVVLFNEAIFSIRQLAFLQAPVQSIAWGIWARQLSLQSSLLVTLLPPTVGGLTVGLFRYLAGGAVDYGICTTQKCYPLQCLGISAILPLTEFHSPIIQTRSAVYMVSLLFEEPQQWQHHLSTSINLVYGVSNSYQNHSAGGFQDPPPLNALEAKQTTSSSTQDLLKGFKELSEQAVHRLQGSPDELPPSSDGEDRARLQSGGAASKSDPGSRDFQLKDAGTEPARTKAQSSDSEEASTSGKNLPTGACPIWKLCACPLDKMVRDKPDPLTEVKVSFSQKFLCEGRSRSNQPSKAIESQS